MQKWEFLFKEKEVATSSSSTSSSWAGWAVGALASKFYKGPSASTPKEGGDSSSSTHPSSVGGSTEDNSNTSTPSGLRKNQEKKTPQELKMKNEQVWIFLKKSFVECFPLRMVNFVHEIIIIGKTLLRLVEVDNSWQRKRNTFFNTLSFDKQHLNYFYHNTCFI